ncbi:MAG: hypothetical protein JNM56_11480 [Planctomycetia bacterium]|nr:hypothetical protein [Planctomycetia bacterium]
MSEPIFKVVDALPAKNMTTRVLHALDWVVPGQWNNLVGFENSIKVISGEDDQKMIQKIGERAIALYNDKGEGYQTALWLYRMVDNLQGMAGWAALANKIGENISMLSLMNKLTPKADTTQGIDFCVKLVVEIVAFCKLNGIPGDSVADFVKSLSDYRDEALMRMAALICLDGLLPLGPDFMVKALGFLDKSGAGDLEKNERYQQVKSLIPGENAKAQLGFISQGVGAVKDWAGKFVASRDLGTDKLVGSLKNFMSGIDGKLDYVAALLDMTTNYYEHTGTQSVARSLIVRAMGEI